MLVAPSNWAGSFYGSDTVRKCCSWVLDPWLPSTAKVGPVWKAAVEGGRSVEGDLGTSRLSQRPYINFELSRGHDGWGQGILRCVQVVNMASVHAIISYDFSGILPYISHLPNLDLPFEHSWQVFDIAQWPPILNSASPVGEHKVLLVSEADVLPTGHESNSSQWLTKRVISPPLEGRKEGLITGEVPL